MENKNIKIHYDNKVYLSFLMIFLFGIGILVAKYMKQENCDEIGFDIIAQTFTTGDLIEFKSIGDTNYKWEWDFGDRSQKEYVSNTLHKYDSVGLYTITLKVNNSCVVNRQLYIKERVYVKKSDLERVPVIVFPDEIRAGDLITFECTSDYAKKWEWRFGETDKVDDISAITKYKFEEEGTYKISLIVNDDIKNALIRTIDVLPKKNERRRRRSTIDPVDNVLLNQIPDKPDVEASTEVKKIKLSRKDAKKMLQDYAIGKIDYTDIKHNFCSNNIRVVNPSGKISSLKELLTAIRGKQINLIDISLYKNESTGCVKTINIDLKIKGTFFWKKY
ncbi:MAG: PKD domain-containing protein [Flavobacteriaceae bacterium]|nr:PKD domain-containing protein [Flavobacteriaceae bacterium]